MLSISRFFYTNLKTIMFFSIMIIYSFLLYKFSFDVNLNIWMLSIGVVVIFSSFRMSLIIIPVLISIFSLATGNSSVTFGIIYNMKYFVLLMMVFFPVLLYKYKSKHLFKDNKLLVILLITISFFFFYGLLSGYNYYLQNIKEVFLFSFWLIPLILPKLLDKKDVDKIIKGILGILFIISVLYFQAKVRGLSNYSGGRVFTRQIFLFSYLLPYVYSMIYISKSIILKRTAIIIFLISLGAIIISQTRTVLGLVFFSILIFHFFYPKFNLKKLIYTPIFLITSLVIYKPILSIFLTKEVINDRFNLSKIFLDSSFLMRFVVGYDVISKEGLSLLIGKGFGSEFTFTPGMFAFTKDYWVDIGYISILEKTGIIGLVIILIIIFISFKASFINYKKNFYLNDYHRIIVFGTLSAIPTVMLENFMFSVLIKYVYYIIFVILLALPIYYEKKSSNNTAIRNR